MSLELIDDKDTWNNFVEVSPYGQLFHRWEFLKIVEKHSGCKLFTYGVYKGKELICIFPLFYRGKNGIKAILSPPAEAGIPFMGFVISPSYPEFRQRKKENYVEIIAKDIIEELKKVTPNQIAFSLPPNFSDVREFVWDGYKAEINFTYVIDMEKPLDELLESFDEECKAEIRSVARQNLILKEMTDIDALYRALKKKYDRQGLSAMLPGQPYLTDLLSAFPDNLKVYALYDSDSVVECLVNFEYKGRLTCWVGAVSPDKNAPALEYLIWELIKEKKARGFKEMEIQDANLKRLCLLRSKLNPGLEYFFYLHKNDTKGKLAEFASGHLLKTKWFSI
jgi:hypothetical protein